MGRAIFVGLSVAFFGAYVAIANALGILGAGIDPLTVPTAPDTGGGFFGSIEGIVAIFAYGFTLFGQFLKLITFQLPGQETTSLITALIFIPLGFINGYIVFTAIRGS